jgi:hypothetical protein
MSAFDPERTLPHLRATILTGLFVIADAADLPVNPIVAAPIALSSVLAKNVVLVWTPVPVLTGPTNLGESCSAKTLPSVPWPQLCRYEGESRRDAELGGEHLMRRGELLRDLERRCAVPERHTDQHT